MPLPRRTILLAQTTTQRDMPTEGAGNNGSGLASAEKLRGARGTERGLRTGGQERRDGGAPIITATDSSTPPDLKRGTGDRRLGRARNLVPGRGDRSAPTPSRTADWSTTSRWPPGRPGQRASGSLPC